MNNEKQYIYILLSDTGTLFTKMIKRFTKAPYNHASIVFDKELQEIYSFGRKKPRNPLLAGFVKEDVYTGTYRHFQNTRCVILKKKVTPEELANIRLIIQEFVANQDRYAYNLIGLAGFLIKYPLGRKNAYFCSQFVSEVFNRGGCYLWDRHSALIKPADFILHSDFEIIYEGYLYDYPLLIESRLTETVPKHWLLEMLPFNSFKKIPF